MSDAGCRNLPSMMSDFTKSDVGFRPRSQGLFPSLGTGRRDPPSQGKGPGNGWSDCNNSDVGFLKSDVGL